MRVLVVEDEVKIAAFIVKGLAEAGFAVDHAANGTDGLHLALNEAYDAAVIDIMLPELDGLGLIDEMRRRQVNTPVIILSAKKTVADCVRGLQTGSDDYLVKPFSFASAPAFSRFFSSSRLRPRFPPKSFIPSSTGPSSLSVPPSVPPWPILRIALWGSAMWAARCFSLSC
jgi:DNA-binding response OmpR family regulator